MSFKKSIILVFALILNLNNYELRADEVINLNYKHELEPIEVTSFLEALMSGNFQAYSGNDFIGNFIKFKKYQDDSTSYILNLNNTRNLIGSADLLGKEYNHESCNLKETLLKIEKNEDKVAYLKNLSDNNKLELEEIRLHFFFSNCGIERDTTRYMLENKIEQLSEDEKIKATARINLVLKTKHHLFQSLDTDDISELNKIDKNNLHMTKFLPLDAAINEIIQNIEDNNHQKNHILYNLVVSNKDLINLIFDMLDDSNEMGLSCKVQ